jgi:DNA-binding IclR family transcriptional regulator
MTGGRSRRASRAKTTSRVTGAGNSDTWRSKSPPQHHRTVDRVTRILEEVVYKSGMTFVELVRALGAAKSSVHGFMRGLRAIGWLYENDGRYYLGPAVYGLTLASGHIRAGLVTHADLEALHAETGTAVFLGVEAGDHLIYVSETGSDAFSDFEARSNIRRSMLATAGGKALLAAKPSAEREAYLRRQRPDEAELIDTFLEEYEAIATTGVARNIRRRGTRFAIATTVRDQTGQAVASVTVVGPTSELQPRERKLAKLLLKHVGSWSRRSLSPREAI